MENGAVSPPAEGLPPLALAHRSPWWAGALALGWAGVGLTWGAAVAGWAAPLWLARTALAVAGLATIAWIGHWLVDRLRARREGSIGLAAVLPALVVLALTVRFVGLASEVGGRYYLDEGTYYHHAAAINDGEPLRRSFVYPHLLYYADAVVLWVAVQAPPLASAWSRLYGVSEPLARAWLDLRSVVALLSALTVVPVYLLGVRLLRGRSGVWAGALAALFLIASPLYNEGSHLNTCDIPSAFFATVCLAVAARLLDEERLRDYGLAGMAAGLAAGSKYPAGVVAVAIAALWIRWRRVHGPRRWGLTASALAALVTFVAVMPSLIAYPEFAFGGGRGLFFGVQQYGRGGWLGVMPGSNATFYLDHLNESFGWPALVAGLLGLLALPRPARTRLLWMLPFPVLYLALISSMNMAVKRNLDPVLPSLALVLGVGVVGGLGRLVAAWPRGAASLAGPWAKRIAGTVVGLALLALPASSTWGQEVGLVRPSTRELAAAWLAEHLPRGVAILKESYTPDLDARRFAVEHQRFATRMSPAEMAEGGFDYLLLSSAAYARFADPEALTKPHQREFAERYREIFARFPLLEEWDPDEMQMGPVLRLYRVDPDPKSCQPTATLAAADAFSQPGMQPAPERPLRWQAPGDWALFKACLPPGRYRVEVVGAIPGSGALKLFDVTGLALGTVRVDPGDQPGGEFSVPRQEKVLFDAVLPPGSRVRSLELRPADLTSPRPGVP
jgi:hypothetical protein